MDAFDRNRKAGGFSKRLTKQDSVSYIKKIAAEARIYNMSTGLKNTEEFLASVTEHVRFAVNEECASTADSDGCIPLPLTPPRASSNMMDPSSSVDVIATIRGIKWLVET